MILFLELYYYAKYTWSNMLHPKFYNYALFICTCSIQAFSFFFFWIFFDLKYFFPQSKSKIQLFEERFCGTFKFSISCHPQRAFHLKMVQAFVTTVHQYISTLHKSEHWVSKRIKNTVCVTSFMGAFKLYMIMFAISKTKAKTTTTAR